MLSIADAALVAIGSSAASSREDRGARSCAQYPTANSLLSHCATATPFCTRLIHHSGTTATVAVHRTTSVNAQFLTTTIILTATTQAPTSTITVTPTETDSTATTVTIAPTCTTPVAIAVDKRKVGPSCGVTSLSPARVSGACACLLDSTTTKTAIVTVTRAISTITSYASTATVKPITTVSASVNTTTETTTSTATSTFPCQPSSTYATGSDQYLVRCNVNPQGYQRTTVDATSFDDCMDQCSSYNSANTQFSCTGITFTPELCSANCNIFGGFQPDSDDRVDPTEPLITQYGRLLSPGIADNGNLCNDGVTKYGDMFTQDDGMQMTVFCSWDSPGNGTPNDYCQASTGDDDCFGQCNYEDDGCVAVTFANNHAADDNCCPKFGTQAFDANIVSSIPGIDTSWILTTGDGTVVNG